MAKHKCGSCHFFQEAGLAGSGWCHHPQRKVSSDVLIMVRRNELACRDEWSRSLWQPRQGHQSNGDVPFQRPPMGPLPPALAENLRSVLHHDLALASAAQGEDVLLSEARIVSEEQGAWESRPRPFPVGNFDPRTAIFRAREAYRERVRAKATAERQSGGMGVVIGFSESGDSASGSTERAAADAEIDMPPAETEPVTDIPDNALEPDPWTSDSGEPVSPRAESSHPPVTEPGRDAVGNVPLATAGEGDLTGPVSHSQLVASRPDLIGRPAAGTPAIDKDDSARHSGQLDEGEELPEWFRSDLPRTCRTCRDYRPSADGQRGWCANSWAFTHRRLVLEEDSAPCQSAIGDWWLPVDDVWLVAADVSSHGRPTPLLDRLTAKVEQQRRRS